MTPNRSFVQKATIKHIISTLLAGSCEPFPCHILLKKFFADIQGEIKSHDLVFTT